MQNQECERSFIKETILRSLIKKCFYQEKFMKYMYVYSGRKYRKFIKTFLGLFCETHFETLRQIHDVNILKMYCLYIQDSFLESLSLLGTTTFLELGSDQIKKMLELLV
jgi:hypothetical protein